MLFGAGSAFERAGDVGWDVELAGPVSSWSEGVRSTERLHEELRARGFRGSLLEELLKKSYSDWLEIIDP